jgi:hypothetical protein
MPTPRPHLLFPARRAGRRHAIPCLLALALATVLVMSGARVASAQADRCPPPPDTGGGLEAPSLPQFMKEQHLPPFLAFMRALYEDDYLGARLSLCRILNATRTDTGRRLMTRDLDQEQFEYLLRFREVVGRAERVSATLMEMTVVPEASRQALNGLAIEVGAACESCHEATGGPVDTTPRRPRKKLSWAPFPGTTWPGTPLPGAPMPGAGDQGGSERASIRADVAG